ncbi:MAG: redoxin domain-containing protein [Rhizobiales bacterium]|nr:redoxin domain-containing protein [Hyphomicrobiales bacterium]
MRIKKGDRLEEIVLPKHDGTEFKLSEVRGKRVLLTFYRVAGCSFCNLRINELQKRFNEFGDNFTHIGIFHSPVDNLEKYMKKHGELPFVVLADEEFKYFKKYNIQRSFTKLLTVTLLKIHKIFPAIMRGYIPLTIKGHFDIAVADILINEDGVVDDVYYARTDVADHFPFDRVKEFSLL